MRGRRYTRRKLYDSIISYPFGVSMDLNDILPWLVVIMILIVGSWGAVLTYILFKRLPPKEDVDRKTVKKKVEEPKKDEPEDEPESTEEAAKQENKEETADEETGE